MLVGLMFRIGSKVVSVSVSVSVATTGVEKGVAGAGGVVSMDKSQAWGNKVQRGWRAWWWPL